MVDERPGFSECSTRGKASDGSSGHYPAPVDHVRTVKLEGIEARLKALESQRGLEN